MDTKSHDSGPSFFWPRLQQVCMFEGACACDGAAQSAYARPSHTCQQKTNYLSLTIYMASPATTAMCQQGTARKLTAIDLAQGQLTFLSKTCAPWQPWASAEASLPCSLGFARQLQGHLLPHRLPPLQHRHLPQPQVCWLHLPWVW